MKLSQFKAMSIKKKLEFVNGELIQIPIDAQQVCGEINFYTINIEKLEIINEKVMSKLEDNDSNELLMYEIIPYITDVESDITFEEFMQILNNPSNSFVAFMQEILMSINEMFGTIDNLSKVVETSNKLSDVIVTQENDSVNTKEDKTENKIEKNIDTKEVVELNEEELLDGLYDQLGKTSDREIRKKLIKRITDLQKS